jgi:hypothetical protein
VGAPARELESHPITYTAVEQKCPALNLASYQWTTRLKKLAALMASARQPVSGSMDSAAGASGVLKAGI